MVESGPADQAPHPEQESALTRPAMPHPQVFPALKAQPLSSLSSQAASSMKPASLQAAPAPGICMPPIPPHTPQDWSPPPSRDSVCFISVCLWHLAHGWHPVKLLCAEREVAPGACLAPGWPSCSLSLGSGHLPALNQLRLEPSLGGTPPCPQGQQVLGGEGLGPPPHPPPEEVRRA